MTFSGSLEGAASLQTRIILGFLVFFSFLTIIYPSIVNRLLAEGMILLWALSVGHRLKAVSQAKLIIGGVIFLAAALSWALAGRVPELEYLLRLFNLLTILSLARYQDLEVILKVGFWIAFASFFIALGVYLLQIKVHFVKTYDTQLFLGSPTNAGLFFELNYAAMVTSLFLCSPIGRLNSVSLTAFLAAFFTFRTGFIYPILIFFNRYFRFRGDRLAWFIGTLVGVCLLYFLYLKYPILLEQRYYIWKSFFDGYQVFRIYSVAEATDLMFAGMQLSPWGAMGNAHSGFIEAILHSGLLYGLIMPIVTLVGVYCVDIRHRALMVFTFFLSFLMSQSLGGVGPVSLLATFLLAASFCFERTNADKN